MRGKPHIERTLGSAASLFAQFLTGYTGRSAEYRGRKVAGELLWSLPQLQELLEEWISSAWQNRPHDGLRDPLAPGRAFSPNEKYAALVETAGYLPLPLTAEDYLELLPARGRRSTPTASRSTTGSTTATSSTACGGRSPASPRARTGGRCATTPTTSGWSGSATTARTPGSRCPGGCCRPRRPPFGELAWDHSARALHGQHGQVSEDAIAEAVDDLLERAGTGPGDEKPARQPRPARGRGRGPKVAGRTQATSSPAWPRPQLPPTAPPADPAADEEARDTGQDGETAAVVVPLKVFDARKEARKWW